MIKADPPKLVSEYPNYRVKSKRKMGNYYFTFPAGTMFSFTTEPTVNKSLIADPCPCCGVQASITVKTNRRGFEKDFDFYKEENDRTE